MKFKLIENLILNQEDIYINIDKFINNASNILLVTGISGSGKSTLSKELADKYDASIIELDYLETYLYGKISINQLYREEQFALIKFLESLDSKDIELDAYKLNDAYIEFLVKEYCPQDSHSRFIINGIQIYEICNSPSWLQELPIVIKGTSALVSTIRRIKRDRSYGFSDSSNIKNWIPLLKTAINADNKLSHLKQEIH